MNDAYRQLVEQFCRKEGLACPENLDALFPFFVGNVPFIFAPVNDGDGVRMLLTVHYGDLPASAPALIYRRLLEANAQAFDSLQPKFGMDAESGGVLLNGTLALASLTPESLAALVRGQVEVVEEWRRTRFLKDEERARATTSAPVATSRHALLRPQAPTFGR